MNKLLSLCLISLAYVCAFAQKKETGFAAHNINAVLWYQHSSEAQACYLQTFNYAIERLRALAATGKKNMAIVSDLDETLIANSFFYGKLIKENKAFSLEAWQAWEQQVNAGATPGAQNFLKVADSLGFTIFYLSNRYAKNTKYTLENIKKLNFPQADTSHMLLYTTTTNKEPRRQYIIAKGYNIEMFLGDNLNDFNQDFEKKMPEDRHKVVDEVKYSFGKNYFVFPNPMYGAWMDALHGYQHHLSEQEKAVIREQRIRAH
ncbi:MAG: 5'-nucleotidase, lipoprotein e(P4) family [Cytophagales bacterium]|nr:5'-nucleotidase, lipoprotein e(P4) family [Cytophagales bacterium]